MTELSEAGTPPCAGMSLKPGDLIEVEFEMPIEETVQAVVRKRTGYNVGLEFVGALRGLCAGGN